MTRWVALLRGINVGPSNRLAMPELRLIVDVGPAAESDVDPKLLHVLFLDREPALTGAAIDPERYDPDR